MQTIIYVKNYQKHKIGDIEIVTNNIAHGLIEMGVARIYSREIKKEIKEKIKAFRKPPADKMMRPKKKPKARVKKGEYETK